MKSSRLINRRAINNNRSTNNNNNNNSNSRTNVLEEQKECVNLSNEDQICNICAQNVPGPEREKIFAFGKCDHHVCYVCSTRLRVICEQSECPICRKELDCVIFDSSRDQPFDKYNLKNYSFNEKYRIYFEKEATKEAFEKLLSYECLKCLKANKHSSKAGTRNTNVNNKLDKDKLGDEAQGLLDSSKIANTRFDDVFGLKNHLNYVHKLNLCDLCLTHNKLFPFEYSYYDKLALKRHTESGEPRTSHRGHPRCSLCEEVFFNADELLQHMSREHYHCHVCARINTNMRMYFLDYNTLRQHFKSKHILCERDNCKHEQFTSVFDNEIELHLHIMQFHPNQSAGLSRSEARQQRTITLDQSSTSRGRDDLLNTSTGRRNLPPNTAIVSTGPVATANSARRQARPESFQAQVLQQRLPSRAEFPSLNQSSTTATTNASSFPRPSQPVQASYNSSYPSLVPTDVNTRPATVSTSQHFTSTLSQRLAAGPSRSNGLFVRSVAGNNRTFEPLNDMEFPPLPEQPKAKSKAKGSKKPKMQQKNDVEQETTLEQLIRTSLSLSGRNNKSGNSKKMTSKGGSGKQSNKKNIKQKAIKIQL